MPNNCSIRDNFSNNCVGGFLIENIETDSNLSFVSEYFTINTYEKLSVELDNVNSLKLLSGEPRFIKNVSSSTNAKNIIASQYKLYLPKE